MKTKIITTIVSLFAFTFVFAQNTVKQYYESDSKLGGDVVIKSAEIKFGSDDEIQKVFEIESPASGSYYLDAWLSAPLTSNGYPEYKIAVNNVISTATLKPQISNWQNVALTNSGKSATTIKLKKGINYVSVIGEKFEVPNVEFVKLSSSALNTGISDKKYKDYINAIKTNTIAVSTDTTSISPFATPGGTDGEVYNYKLDMPVTYTTMFPIMCIKDDPDKNLIINCTTPNSNFEYVIELFYYLLHSPLIDTESKYCKGNDKYIFKGIGFYYLRIRSFRQGIQGVVDIELNYPNGKVENYKNCPVGGNGFASTNINSSKFFICHKQYQACFLLESKGIPGYIEHIKLDSIWSNGKHGSLITTDKTNIGAGLVSAQNSSDPIFYTDMYLGLSPAPSRILSTFPNMSTNESFYSAPATSNYNCISWTVGVTNDWIWPGDYSISNFDALYNSYGYTRTGANADNAAIAIWVKDGILKHGSVRKNSMIPKPHGFDWESKCGHWERVMHTRDALTNSSYGNIAYYYRPISGTVNSLAESPVTISTFSSTDVNIINALIDEIPTEIKSEFNKKYAAWKETWNNPEIAIQSNPRSYAESEEYSALCQFCQQYGKPTWPLFIEKLSEGDVFVCNLLEDLTSPTKENKTLYDEAISVKTRSIGIPSPFIYSNMVEYSKRLLNKENINIKNSIRNIANADILVPNVNITANNGNILLDIHTEKTTAISVNIYDAYGVSVYNTNYSVANGGWRTSINTANFKNGTYIVRIIMNGKTISQKINI